MSMYMFTPHNTLFLEWLSSVAEVQKSTQETEKLTVSFPDGGTKLAGNSQGQLFRLGLGVVCTGSEILQSQGQYFRQGLGD